MLKIFVLLNIFVETISEFLNVFNICIYIYFFFLFFTVKSVCTLHINSAFRISLFHGSSQLTSFNVFSFLNASILFALCVIRNILFSPVFGVLARSE